ncbi:MAG: hypothetical protein AMS27_00895 [Bacteroides sp. SM23_62_1]|nr:MAG: hypothetical protein AMS27_00895 [Bacteroides sp. SM23_62_1]
MKNIYSILLTILITPLMVIAQNETDALRYSRNYFGGTTRVSSMAGAFGALGGDFGSLSINPAGLGVFRTTEFTLSPSLSFDKTKGSYLGQETSDIQNQFFLNNLGIVTTHLTGKDNGFVSVSFGVGYNRLNNFHRNVILQARMPAVTPPVSTERPENGGSSSSSYLDNFVNYANGAGPFNPDNLDPFYEELAWYADLIYYDSSALSYQNDINYSGYGQFQRQTINERGGMGEYTFGVGTNFSNMVYFGATFGIDQLRFSQDIVTLEEDDLGSIDYFNSFRFGEYLNVFGTGYSAKFGMIIRPISLIRIGAAFHIPTFYKIREEFNTELRGTFDEVSETHEESPVNTFEYWLRTPYRAIGSVGFQIPKIATINLDYELVDYSTMNMNSGYIEDFIDVNQGIKDIYKLTSNLRAGAEVVIKPFYLRAGIAFYGSPYVDDIPGINTYNMLYAGGFGFRSEKFFFDFGAVNISNAYKYDLYDEDAFNATIDGRKLNFMTTLGFKF